MYEDAHSIAEKYSDICENCDCHAYSKAEKMIVTEEQKKR